MTQTKNQTANRRPKPLKPKPQKRGAATLADLAVGALQADSGKKRLRPTALSIPRDTERLTPELRDHHDRTPAEPSDKSYEARPAVLRALARAKEVQEADLERAGGTLTTAEVAELLGGISRQAVHKKLRAGKLLAVPKGDQNRYPLRQFTGEGPVEGLSDVLDSLPVRSPWARLHWFFRPEPTFGEEPIDLLRTGRLEDAIAAARRYGEQGAR